MTKFLSAVQKLEHFFAFQRLIGMCQKYTVPTNNSAESSMQFRKGRGLQVPWLSF